MTQTITPTETDTDWLADSLNRRPTKRRNLTIPEHAETTVIPTGKYRGVTFRNDRAPYMIKPMQLLSPQSNIQDIRLMWSAQTGKNTVGEQAVLYYIEEEPSEILYVGSDERQARKWLEKRIVPRALKAGIEFRAQSDNKTSSRSGDTLFAKEFDGGNLDAASSRSPAQLASETKRFVMADETDRWKLKLGPEGFTWDIMYARTQAWGDQKKILAISTPTTFDESLIYPLFLEGDRQEYFVPCPICGKYQLLNINDGKQSGLTWETKAGRIIKDYVYYLCDFCHDAFFESDKYDFLNAGNWIAQAEPISSTIASFHINAIYSPFKEWIEIAREYNKAIEEPEKMHTFNNLVMGMPHKETGHRPKIEKVISHRGDYKSWEINNDILWITSGADVQRGKKIYNEMSDSDFDIEIKQLEKGGANLWTMELPRIELEVIGHSHGYRTNSIGYKIFYGNTADPYGGAWEKLRQWIHDTGLIFERVDGSKIPVSRMFIDSGDGERTNTVYSFCEEFPGILPCKGDQVLKKNITEKGDEITGKMFLRYSVSKIGQTQRLVTIATNYYKNLVYKSLDIPRTEDPEQRPRFPDFPKDYPDHYFKMLTNEEKHIDGSFHAGGRPVEALDCRVYGICASDFWIDEQVYSLREKAIKAGMPKKKAEQFYTSKSIVEGYKVARLTEIDKMKK